MAGTSSTFGKKDQILHSQAREIIANVMQNEAELYLQTNKSVIPLTNYKQRVMAATEISEKTYKTIVKEATAVASGELQKFSTPPKKQQKFSSKYELVEGEKHAVRAIIHDFHVTEKTTPTVEGIIARMRAIEISFNGSEKIFRKILQELGFSHESSIGWYHDSQKGLRKPLGKGRCLIMVHAGNENGFVHDSLLIFPSGSKSGDYHDDMNWENFEKWVRTKLLPNLPEKSVLVVDNASYHNTRAVLEPTMATRKANMLQWLRVRNIPHDPTQTKPQIYQIVKVHKSETRVYKLNQLLEEHNYRVLCLPPYHPELNPIEKVWAQVKGWLAARNTTFKMHDVENLTREAFSTVTPERWSSICQHVRNVEEDYKLKEPLLDEALE